MRNQNLNEIEIESGGTLGILGNFGGTFNLGYFDVGEPIGAEHSALPLRNSVRTL